MQSLRLQLQPHISRGQDKSWVDGRLPGYDCVLITQISFKVNFRCECRGLCNAYDATQPYLQHNIGSYTDFRRLLIACNYVL